MTERDQIFADLQESRCRFLVLVDFRYVPYVMREAVIKLVR
jgi:hypothetical protein